MNKSIYDEALEIIIIHGTALTESSKTNKLKVIKALKQAQKQEKLLGLYIDLGNKIEVLDNAQGYGILEFDEIKNICNKIKELENDK